MMYCSVHIYKYSQTNRRSQLKRLCKEGAVKYINRTKTHIYYLIVDVIRYKECCKRGDK